MNNKRIIAIHLPQYYPFSENDEWWGKGFTEWRNVVNGRPRFRGHYQPHIPSDLGFYDLRLAECRLEQEKLAKEYGVYGFCYYHYWFNGHLLMEKPVEAKLLNPEENLPFMLCWANENWHRNWDGDYNQTLIEQEYSKEDNIRHFEYLLPFFKDDRYIKVEGKPVFLIYRSSIVPNMEELVSDFQECAKKEGIELYICTVRTGGNQDYKGVEASIDFPPFTISGYYNTYERIKSYIYKYLLHRGVNKIYEYSNYVKRVIDIKKRFCGKKIYPTLCPSWDNASRRRNQPFLCLKNSTPSSFEKWLREVWSKFIPFSKDENFIFINAWNEWAEGNHLEPDLKWGRGYLEAIKRVVEEKD